MAGPSQDWVSAALKVTGGFDRAWLAKRKHIVATYGPARYRRIV
jgi:hypothetical protein